MSRIQHLVGQKIVKPMGNRQHEKKNPYTRHRGKQYKPVSKKGFDQDKHCVVCGNHIKKGQGFYAHDGLGRFFALPKPGYRYCKKTEVVNAEEITKRQLYIIKENTGWIML